VQLLSGIKVVHRLSLGSRNTGQEKEADQRGANHSDGDHSESVMANPFCSRKGVFGHEEQGDAPPKERGKVARFGVLVSSTVRPTPADARYFRTCRTLRRK
jgi:hypothetical protein